MLYQINTTLVIIIKDFLFLSSTSFNMGLVFPLFLWLWCKESLVLSSLPYVFSPIAHSAELGVRLSTMDQSRRERASWVEGERAEQSYYISTVVRLCWVSLNMVVILWNSCGASLSLSPTSFLTPLSSSPYLGKCILSCRSVGYFPNMWEQLLRSPLNPELSHYLKPSLQDWTWIITLDKVTP